MRLGPADAGTVLRPADPASPIPPSISGGYRIPSAAWSPTGRTGVFEAALPAAAAVPSDTAALFVGDARRLRVRTETMLWALPIDTADLAAEVNHRGFRYNATTGQIPDEWDTSPGALAQWRVFAYHAWSNRYHSVVAVHRENSTILFGENSVTAYNTLPGNTIGGLATRRFYIENVAELPLEPGSGRWRFSKFEEHDGRRIATALSYASVAGESLNTTEAVLPLLEQLLSIDGAADVQIEGIVWKHTKLTCPNTNATFNPLLPPACDCLSPGAYVLGPSSALHVVNAPRLLIERATIASTGGSAISINQSPGAVVHRLNATSIGFTGVEIIGSSNVTVADSKVIEFGQELASGNGVEIWGCSAASASWNCSGGSASPIGESLNVTVTHNEFAWGRHNHAFNADCKFDGCRGLDFGNNHVHDCGRTDATGLCDGGGIHVCLGGSTGPAYMHHNHVHHIKAYQWGGAGLYYDDSSTGGHWQSNLVHDVVGQPINWNGFGNTPIDQQAWSSWTDNILIKNLANDFDANTKPNAASLAWTGDAPVTFERNVLAVLPGRFMPNITRSFFYGEACAARTMHKGIVPPHCSDAYADSFTRGTFDRNLWFVSDAATAGRGAGALPALFPTSGNCSQCCNTDYHGCTGCDGSFATWQAAGHDAASLVADPAFSPDFTLLPGSKALTALGVQQIDLAEVGPSW